MIKEKITIGIVKCLLAVGLLEDKWRGK